MDLVTSKRFVDDLKRVKSINLQQRVAAIATVVKEAKSLRSVPNCTKMVNHPTAYRIRIGDYRIGLYLEGNTVVFSRILTRGEIYNVFPD